MKRWFKWLLVLICVMIPFMLMSPVRADSGWDSDYDSGWDSGSSWDSGSDWDSSSSWDDDYDYDYDSDWGSSGSGGSYSSGSGSLFGSMFTIVMFITIVIIIVAASRSKKPNYGNTRYDNSNVMYLNTQQYADIDESKVTALLPNESLGSLKNMAYKKFIAVQNAWSEFDYDKIRELCTDELYNSYISQLDTLKLKKGKNVMSDFQQNSIKITNVKEEAGNIVVTVYLNVSFYDYVINTVSGDVTRGTNQRKLTNNYILTFVKSKDAVADKCPNCGAPIKGNTSSKCEYCGSTIVTDAKDYVLSKKTNVNL